MLSRAILPLLRPRGFRVASQVTASLAQSRGLRNDRGRLRQREEYNLPGSADVPEWKRAEASSQILKGQRSASASQRVEPEVGSEVPRPSQSPRAEVDEYPETKSQSQRPLPDLRDGIPSDFQPEQEQSRPLPDLTKGIPSTLDAELGGREEQEQGKREGLNITEDPAGETPPGAGGRGADGATRNAYVSSSDRRWARIIKLVYASIGAGGLAYALYLGRNWDDEEERSRNKEITDGYSPGLIYKRAMARLGSTMSYYRDPVATQLLPDLNPNPDLQAPYTLVISLEDMLIHSEWSRETGWRVAKRPGVDYFLRYLSQYYEIVLFTSQPSYTVDQIIRKLDPYQMIQYYLFREHTLYKDGAYIKDLSYINRDLKKVVMMDTDASHVKNQPENAIVIPKWKGDAQDKTLVEFIPFLEYLANVPFDDARKVLKSFEGKYIPVEFELRQQAQREKLKARNAEKKKSKRSISGLGSLFGTKPQPADGMQSIDEAAAEGKTIWDMVRERGQKNYEVMEKKIEEEGAKWLADREAEDKKFQEEAMANMKSGVFGWFGGAKDK